MYTQCPECQVAFRVTATVLQQAGGRVRCGGCSHAFNALENLSEELPASTPGPQLAADAAALPPVSGASNSIEEFDAQSKALLETLDELAGPGEVRIEDTGVEWRVLDDDQDADGSGDKVREKTPGKASGSQQDLDLSSAAERRYDDNSPLPDDVGDIEEAAYTPPVDAPKRRSTDDDSVVDDELNEMQPDLALSEPEEWTDILDEVSVSKALEGGANESTETSSATADNEAVVEPEVAAKDSAASGERHIPFEVEEELAAIHSELAGGTTAAAADSAGDAGSDDEIDDATDDEDSVELSVDAIEELTINDDVSAGDEEEDAVANIGESTGAFEKQIADARAALDRGDLEEWSESAPAANEDEDEELSLVEDGDVVIPERAAAKVAAKQPQVATRDEDHVVPPQSDEEISINEEIDQELMLASTSDDVMADVAAGRDLSMFDENSPHVETIIMEGDFIGESIDPGQLEKDRVAIEKLRDPGHLADTYMLNKGKVRGGRRSTDPPGYGVYVGIILLIVALATQLIHASRETLATYGMFNQTIGPVYRALGQPVTPEWDVKGWQFEATNGSSDENGEVLTILSQIVNRSQQPLPYPLVHVSLTDRWEEIIGSRVLEPNGYLAGSLDPSKPVQPGDNFTAVITIDSPAEEATGFKLNVCYRIEPGRVRCAIEDFKN